MLKIYEVEDLESLGSNCCNFYLYQGGCRNHSPRRNNCNPYLYQGGCRNNDPRNNLPTTRVLYNSRHCSRSNSHSPCILHNLR